MGGGNHFFLGGYILFFYPSLVFFSGFDVILTTCTTIVFVLHTALFQRHKNQPIGSFVDLIV